MVYYLKKDLGIFLEEDLLLGKPGLRHRLVRRVANRAEHRGDERRRDLQDPRILLRVESPYRAGIKAERLGAVDRVAERKEELALRPAEFLLRGHFAGHPFYHADDKVPRFLRNAGLLHQGLVFFEQAVEIRVRAEDQQVRAGRDLLLVIRRRLQLLFYLLVGDNLDLPWLEIDRRRCKPDDLEELIHLLLGNLPPVKLLGRVPRHHDFPEFHTITRTAVRVSCPGVVFIGLPVRFWCVLGTFLDNSGHYL